MGIGYDNNLGGGGWGGGGGGGVMITPIDSVLLRVDQGQGVMTGAIKDDFHQSRFFKSTSMGDM